MSVVKRTCQDKSDESNYHVAEPKDNAWEDDVFIAPSLLTLLGK